MKSVSFEIEQNSRKEIFRQFVNFVKYLRQFVAVKNDE